MAGRAKSRRWLLPKLLLLLLGLVLVIEVIARFLVSGYITDAAEQAGAEDVHVEFDARMITPALQQGTLQDVSIQAERFSGSGDHPLPIENVQAQIGSISLDRPQQAHELQLQGVVGLEAINDRIEDVAADIPALENIEMTASADALVLRTDLLGAVPAQVELHPQAHARALQLTPSALTVAGVDVSLERLHDFDTDAAALSPQIELDSLPAGLTLEEARSTEEGLLVLVSGDGVQLQ